MIGGFVADYYGYRQPFIVFGGLCLLALAVIHFAGTENFTPVIESKKRRLKVLFNIFVV